MASRSSRPGWGMALRIRSCTTWLISRATYPYPRRAPAGSFRRRRGPERAARPAESCSVYARSCRATRLCRGEHERPGAGQEVRSAKQNRHRLAVLPARGIDRNQGAAADQPPALARDADVGGAHGVDPRPSGMFRVNCAAPRSALSASTGPLGACLLPPRGMTANSQISTSRSGGRPFGRQMDVVAVARSSGR